MIRVVLIETASLGAIGLFLAALGVWAGYFTGAA